MKLKEKLLGFFNMFPKATVANVAPVEQPVVLPTITTTQELPTTETIKVIKNDSKGKNYKRSSKRGKARSKGSQAGSGLSN